MNCDPLTGLLQRSAFFDALADAITESAKGQSRLALLIINVDRLHTLNIAHGFSQADLLIRQLANRLNGAKRKQDIAGRISADEFALILPDLPSAHVAELAANKIIKSFEKNVDVNNVSIKAKATAGIAICADENVTAEQLLLQADSAIRLARKKHRRYLVAELHPNENDDSKRDLSQDLEDAIANSQLELYYQPKINLNTRLLCGAEALVRWVHPDKGVIEPDSFIPLAERGSSIVPLTLWTLNCALHQTKTIREIWPDFRIAVNLSAGLLDDDDLVELVLRALHTWNMPAGQLVLEITESAVMQNRETSLDNLMQLHEHGIAMSIDDFGTGYSSLAYLKRLPVSELKIDKSFIKQLANSKADTHIVQAIIDVGQNFGLDVLAEGIESAEVIDRLVAMGCQYGQGYWFSRPLTYRNFLNWISRSEWAVTRQMSASGMPQCL
jgi:diguanylate cyclase (GGDEF)-like protein